MIYIYGLSDPRNDIIRYVGKTSNVERRLRAHLKRSGCKYCYAWLTKMNNDGISPSVTILETLSDNDDWASAEKKWIKHFKEQGNKLTNLTEGGEGWASLGRLGKKNSPEHIRKSSRPGIPVKHTLQGDINRANGVRNYYKRMAESGITITRKPCSESRKQKIGKANRGKLFIMTPARLAAIERSKGRLPHNFGCAMSEETKAKLSASTKGKPWTEARRLAQIKRNSNCAK